MFRWCRALVVLQGLPHTFAVRGGTGDACATMCASSEDGRCVYWPSSASRADLAELFCANCSIRDEACSGPLCGDMCRLVDGKCAYHPFATSLTYKPNVEELYCLSCPYCGHQDMLRYFSTRRLQEDESMVRELQALKARTDHELETELGKLAQSERETWDASEALSRSTASERSAMMHDAQLDGSVVGLIAGQSVEEAQLEVDGMSLDAQELAANAQAARQRLADTEQVMIDTSNDMEQAVQDGKRAAVDGRRAELAERRGHVLEDASKVASLVVESSLVEKTKEEAELKAQEVESLQAETAASAKRLASEVQKSAALTMASEKVAAMEEQIASLAGEEVFAVQAAANLSQLHENSAARAAQAESLQAETAASAKRLASEVQKSAALKMASEKVAAMEEQIASLAGDEVFAVQAAANLSQLHENSAARAAQVEDVLQSEKEVAKHARDVAKEVKDGINISLQTANLEGGIASFANQEHAAVLASEGLHHLQHKLEPKLEEVSQQLEKEKEVLRSVDGRATASEMVGHAAALASHHAKQAALDAGKLIKHAFKPHSHQHRSHQKHLPPSPPTKEVRIAVNEVVQNLTQLLPNLMVFGEE